MKAHIAAKSHVPFLEAERCFSLDRYLPAIEAYNTAGGDECPPLALAVAGGCGRPACRTSCFDWVEHEATRSGEPHYARYGARSS
jgi:hypothetical protein